MATEFDGTLSEAGASIEGTAIWGTVIDADTITAKGVMKGVRTTSNPVSRNPDLDITFYCDGYDRFGNPDQGVWFAKGVLSGTKVGASLENTITAAGVISGTAIFGTLYDATMTCAATIEGSMMLLGPKTDWAMWSKIGYANFDVDSSNEAGEMPLDGIGTVWAMRKLFDRIIAYGSNEIQVLQAKEVFWGSGSLHPLGLLNKGAVATKRDQVHWFVDSQGVLWQLDEKMRKLDYRQLFSSMTSLILNYDNENDLLYLCDGTTGYVYNPNFKSMAEGAPNICGIHYADDTTYVTAPAAVTVPAFSMKSAIVDFENRKEKTIFSIEIGTTLTVAIQVRVHWREFHTDSFSTTPWVTFTDRGFAYLPCYGVEFQFELSAASAQALKQIDYVKINGVLHGFSYLDTSSSERWGTVT